MSCSMVLALAGLAVALVAPVQVAPEAQAVHTDMVLVQAGLAAHLALAPACPVALTALAPVPMDAVSSDVFTTGHTIPVFRAVATSV